MWLGTSFALAKIRMWNMKKVAASILLLGALLITDPLASDHHLNTAEDLGMRA